MTRAALLLLLLLATGCSFDRHWRSLARTPETTVQSDPLAGRWEGRWISDSNGHRGKLRAIIIPAGESRYRADFDAMFFTILRAGYSIDLTSKSGEDGTVSFEGEEDLGSLAGGTYRYNGSTDGQSFSATYRSRADNGRFELQRRAGN